MTNVVHIFKHIHTLAHIIFPKKTEKPEWLRMKDYKLFNLYSNFFSSYVQYFLYSEYRIFFRDIFYVYIQIWQQLSINVQFKGSTERRGSLIYQSLSVTYTCRGGSLGQNTFQFKQTIWKTLHMEWSLGAF